jgi:hypothetical protein
VAQGVGKTDLLRVAATIGLSTKFVMEPRPTVSALGCFQTSWQRTHIQSMFVFQHLIERHGASRNRSGGAPTEKTEQMPSRWPDATGSWVRLGWRIDRNNIYNLDGVIAHPSSAE